MKVKTLDFNLNGRGLADGFDLIYTSKGSLWLLHGELNVGRD